jgi:hypothetical protein
VTPYEINILLHYYSRAEDHPDISRNPPIWRPTMFSFAERGLICDGTHGVSYGLTDRGRAYIEALQRIPLPQQVWVMPPISGGALLTSTTD